MYDNGWFKKIKEVNLASQFNPKETGSLNDLAVVELAEAFEPEYVKPACFAWRKGRYYSGPLLVSQESPAWMFTKFNLKFNFELSLRVT